MARPKFYRVMKKEADNKPVVDASGRGLGVRGVPVNGRVDVDLDADGNVILNDKGMSVAPGWRDLPGYLIPQRLQGRFPGAVGHNDRFCFVMGDGPFADGPVATGLLLKRDNPRHGNVIPEVLGLLEQFQLNLADTRPLWCIDES